MLSNKRDPPTAVELGDGMDPDDSPSGDQHLAKPKKGRARGSTEALPTTFPLHDEKDRRHRPAPITDVRRVGTGFARHVELDLLPPDEGALGAEFDRALWEFFNTIDALREMLDVIAPIVTNVDRGPDLPALVESQLLDLEPDKREELRPTLVAMAGILASPDTRADINAGFTEFISSIRELVRDPEALMARGSSAATLLDDLDFPVIDPAVSAIGQELIASSMASVLRPRAKLPLLLTSVVTSAVDAYELLVGRIVAGYYRLVPDAIGGDQKEFSLAEVRAMGSIEEATDAVIDRRVDSFLLSSQTDWEKFFLSRLKIRLSELALDWNATREVQQRRHLIVHAGGRVSQRYKAALSGIATPPVGSLLTVDDGYARSALNLLNVHGTLLATTVWARLVKIEANSAAGRVQQRASMEMDAGRWDAVLCLTKYQQKAFKTKAETTLIARFNEWLARKSLGDEAAVKAEVSDFDVTALDRRFRLVKLLLLDQVEPAEGLAIEALRSGELSARDAEGWPVLEPLRNRPAFKKAKAAAWRGLERRLLKKTGPEAALRDIGLQAGLEAGLRAALRAKGVEKTTDAPASPTRRGRLRSVPER